jgi:hypothetical protein
MSLNQKGFTLVEGLLIVIALSLVSGIGYYVYSANKNVDELQSTSNSSTDDNTPAAKKVDYLEVKELGIRFDKTVAPGTYYKIGDSSGSYPAVPELKFIELYDADYDNSINSKGQKCGSIDSSVVLVVEVMSVSDRDNKYSQYTNASLGSNDDVPTVVSSKYATKVGNLLYDYFKAQGVQAPPTCIQGITDGYNEHITKSYNDSYEKLKKIVLTLEEVDS